MRVFPISNWTELDIWQYIAREKTCPCRRFITPTSAKLSKATACSFPLSPLTLKREGEIAQIRDVRFPLSSAIFPAPALLPVPPLSRPKTSLLETAAANHFGTQRHAHGRPRIGSGNGRTQKQGYFKPVFRRPGYISFEVPNNNGKPSALPMSFALLFLANII